MMDKNSSMEIKPVIPKHRQDALRWDGWGYKDSHFAYRGVECYFTGDKYEMGAKKHIVNKFRDWVLLKFDIDIGRKMEPAKFPKVFPKPNNNPELLEKLKKLSIAYSEEGADRLVRCHDQTVQDIDILKTGMFKRIPDLVAWPNSHDQVVEIVNIANDFDVVIIPYGGGTSVSGSTSCPINEPRRILALDTTQMNKMLWLDKENLLACFESGIVGQDLERELKKIGFTVGHEPDSYEFSTLGGWVATRASGMKKNTYGNIEDIVVRVRMVTSKGVLEKKVSGTRISCGPDFDQMIFGSEGTLGVVTEAVLKIRPLPKKKVYGSVVFPDFETGVKFLREIASKRLQPASIRLIDNDQFQFAQHLKPDGGYFSTVLENFKKGYLTKIQGFDYEKLAVVTLLFEGEEEEVKVHEKRVNKIAKQHGGFLAGAGNGEKGYLLTYMICYIRDFAWDYYIIGQSFETSVAWDKCIPLCKEVVASIHKECAERGVTNFMFSSRVTQSYDAGCCIYFYLIVKYYGLENYMQIYEDIEDAARDVILKCGGSISHHHGIGKHRRKWYEQTVSTVGVGIYKAMKNELDPKNVFALGNLLDENNEHFNSKL